MRSSVRPSLPTGHLTGSASSRPDRSGPSAAERRRRRRTAALFRFDRELGARFVAGADEAGRGSLAGPLVAAAVLFDYERLSRSDRLALGGLDDSKQKTEPDRERLFPVVLRVAAAVAVAVRSVREIDSRGLHLTNLSSLGDCLERVAVPGAICLSDGFRLPTCKVEHRAVIDGDATSAAIAASSVIAKVTRDRYMRRAAAEFPLWDFAGNVGYSTPGHRAAIAEHGICELHRTSFRSNAYSQLGLEC